MKGAPCRREGPSSFAEPFSLAVEVADEMAAKGVGVGK
jgi:hypothetical protein